MAEALHLEPDELNSTVALFVATIFEDETAADCARWLMKRMDFFSTRIAATAEYTDGEFPPPK